MRTASDSVSRILRNGCLSSLLALGGVLATTHAAEGPGPKSPPIDHINPEFMVSPDEAQEWHAVKDAMGPAFSGNSSWKNFLAFVERKLTACGVVDVVRNSWTYQRWHATDWSLVVGGNVVKVAHCAAYSGSTGNDGISAELLYYDRAAPPDSVAGKIVVFSTTTQGNPFALFDYEFLSNPDTFPEVNTKVSASESVAFDTFYQLFQTSQMFETLRAGALGGIVVFDACYERVKGLYAFPVPDLFNVPTLFLDRKAGNEVIQGAKRGETVTLTLLADVEPTETYQLIGFLPGRGYGTGNDETILLSTHTDGPAISQDNGAFALLAIVRYFSHIPQAQRPRTLMIFLDNRHYMPGMEDAFEQEDWFERHPEAVDSIVAHVATEHLGQVEYREAGDVFEPTGRVEPSFLYATHNPLLIDMAVQAVKNHGWPRALVQCVDRPGIHGASQGIWFGMGRRWKEKGLPGYACMGSQGAYWATTAGLDKFDKDLFCTEVTAMTQLTGKLMKADLAAIETVK